MARTAFLALLIVAILGVLGPALDDNSAEWQQSSDLSDAQRQARQQLRKELAAARMCRETAPGAALVWTADGEAVCVPRTLR